MCALAVVLIGVLGSASGLALAGHAHFSTQVCGTERWPIKTLQDPAGRKLSLQTVTKTTASALRAKPIQRGLRGSRGRGVESTQYEIRARLVEAKVEDDSDIHLVVSDPVTSDTMIVEFPLNACASKATVGAKARMAAARNAFVDACGLPGDSSFMQLAGQATIRGIGFFDFPHGQTGAAPNGIELHPVLRFSSGSCHAVPAQGPPQVWFAPLPVSAGGPYNGSGDYFQLFDPRAPWQSAASHVNVFKIYPYFAGQWATPYELRALVTDLRRRGIALAVEDGPLEPVPECGPGEGFGGTAEAEAVGSRIAAAHGTVDYVAFDEPYYYGHLSNTSGCHWSAERIAADVARYEATMRHFFPNVVFGDIEPVVSPDLQPDEIAHWLDVYAKVTGSPLAFFHADVQWQFSSWPSVVKTVEDAARTRGVHFGIIYNGDYNAASDSEWTQTAEQRAVTYEQSAGGKPDDVLFQSWHDHPDYVLPETTPGRFTWLIDRYFADHGR